GESRVELIKEEEEKVAEVVATTETKFPMYGEERHQSRDWEIINEISVGLCEVENLEECGLEEMIPLRLESLEGFSMEGILIQYRSFPDAS
ncbi:hypothetical protein Tco_0200014, partial [Tanacetum coccineum]